MFILVDGKSCLQRALECERLAKVAPGPVSRTMFAEIAFAWRHSESLCEPTEPHFNSEPVKNEAATQTPLADSNYSFDAELISKKGVRCDER